jgi:hypothetical protein
MYHLRLLGDSDRIDIIKIFPFSSQSHENVEILDVKSAIEVVRGYYDSILGRRVGNERR